MNEQFLQIIKEVIPSISKQDLELPIRDTGIDSLDLVVIRVALEKHFGFEISDVEWFRFNTLNEALNYFTNHRSVQKSITKPSKNISIEKQIEITMPQMANNSLSENWLLKELGDLHWKLLSDGIEQKSSQFIDEMGNRLYATFTRICYSTTSLNHFIENDIINFLGIIKRFGNATYLSEISAESGNNIIKAKLMTTFSVRSLGDNSKIERSNPLEKVNHIEEIKGTPEFLNEYRLLRKNLTNKWKLSDYTFFISNETLFECNYRINPYYEMNGVGLLYFASYPIISDYCESEFFNSMGKYGKWENQFFTSERDICYF
ncbi:MAG: hypothetical protein KGZ58_10045, partial [Ignavibacteriales bacterium]|nr:hypothetical protein [Ignavibacteriales bacterium]